jgi:hypothetical protein
VTNTQTPSNLISIDKNTMLKAIKQEVTVLPNGVVPFRSPELRAGSRVEVIVLLKETSPPPPRKRSLLRWGKVKVLLPRLNKPMLLFDRNVIHGKNNGNVTGSAHLFGCQCFHLFTGGIPDICSSAD